MKLMRFIIVTAAVFVPALRSQSQNLGMPVNCQRASDYGFSTDDTSASLIPATTNGSLLITWITNALTPGTPESKTPCLFRDGKINTGNVQIYSSAWDTMQGNIRFEAAAPVSLPGTLFGSGLTLAQVNPHGFDLRFTDGTTAPKMKFTFNGAVTFVNGAEWSGAGAGDTNSYIGVTQTSLIQSNHTIIGAQVGTSVAKQIGILYGMSTTFGGYNSYRIGLKALGLCTIAKYDGGGGSSPNSVRSIGDYFAGGDTATPGNCDVYDMSGGNPGRNNTIEDCLIELSNFTVPNTQPPSQSIRSVVHAGNIQNLTIKNCGFWDDKGSSMFTANSQPSGTFYDDSNYFSMIDAKIANTLPVGQGNIVPQHIMTATTGSIGGILTAGTCDTGTVAITQAGVGMPVAWSPTSAPTAPGAGFYVKAYIAVAGTVTVDVCAAIAGTPTASTYTVQVLQPGK